MYFPTFFPASVRSYDGRAPGLGGPLELPVMGTGREREIPLDLSIKTVRQSADSTADPDEVGLLLDHRKFLGLAAAGFAGRGLPSSLLDPAALFRLPYRTDAAACSGMSVPAIASPFCHPMMAGILQQRERCLDPHSARTAAPQPVSPYMDPASAAALSLHLRSAAAAAAGVNAANQREANAAALSARAIFGVPALQGSVGIPGYSLFPEFFQHASAPTLQPPPSTDPSRRPEEKGAFTTLRPTPTQPTPTSSSSAAANDKTFLSNSALDAARYAEHMQRIHEQHLQAKCNAACCVPTSASAVISGLAHHQATCGGGSCACCVIPGSSPHCPTALSRGTVPHLSFSPAALNNKDGASPATRTPTSTPNSSAKNSSSSGSVKSEASTRSEPTMPIYVPTTTAWTSGLTNIPNQLGHTQGHVVYANGTNTTTSHAGVGKSHLSSHQSSRKKDKDRSGSKDHSSERSKFENSPSGNSSRTPSSNKDSGNGSSKLTVIDHSSRSNHHNHVQGQYHHSHHGSHHSKHANSTAHQKSNNHHHRNGSSKEDNEIIVIDDVEPKNSNLHRPQPTFPAIAGCNGLKIPAINSLDRSQGPPLHIPHRPVPEHRPRSPVKRSRSPTPSYPEVTQPIPSKMPRLEAVVRPNPGLPDPAESLSPTGPPSLIASVVPTLPVMPPSVYVPIFHGHLPPGHHLRDDETGRLKKLHAMLPPSQHPIPFVNGNRVPVPNGIPSDSPRVPSPCPAVVEPTGAEVVVAVAASEPFASPAFPGGTPYNVDNSGKEMSVATLAESNKSPRTRSPEATACGSSHSVVATKPQLAQQSMEKTSREIVSHTPLIIPVPVMSASLAAKKSYLSSSVRVSSPSSLAKKEHDGPSPAEAAAADKRQRVLDLYSDLSEIDQQDLDAQKGVRLREFDSEAALLKSKQIKPETSSTLQTSEVCTSEISPTKPSSNTGPYGASAARCDLAATSTSPPPSSPKGKGRASAVEEELRQEALRVADARAKKKLRRRLLERLYHERMGVPCPDESETDSPPNEEAIKDGDDDVSDDAKVEFEEKTKLSGNEDVKSETEKSDGKVGDHGQDRRALSQLNLTWRQRRLMQISCSHAVRRKRFRSGLDMIARRQKKKSKSQCNSDKKKEDQRKMCHMEEAFAKVVCEATGDLVMPPEMKRLMVNKALGETILHRAARQCYPDVVLYCLETKCCDVNGRDNAGYTPLHECCSRGHLEIARALLQYGADVNASAAGGIRPLHDAVENDHVEVVRLLLSFGADPTISTYSGLSPLKLARSPVMAEFLRGFMADITGDADGRPVLPWQFMGSASCLDPEEMGFDVLDGVPSDSGGDGELQVGGDDFLFEVSDSPHLPTFRLQLPSSKASCNCLRLSDVLKQTALSKDEFRGRFPLIEVVSMPRHEFEASATCSQLLTGTKLDALLLSAGDDPAGFVDVVKLDHQIRVVLGIETITLR